MPAQGLEEMERILNDEPSRNDELGRLPYANALATTIMRCEMPFTIGIFGDWGAGKTTLLRLVEDRVKRLGAKCVWFNAWLHQQHTDPALAMLHTIAADLRLGNDARKLLMVVGAALATTALKITTQVAADDIKKIAEDYEKERFERREDRTRLREKFTEFVKCARDGEQFRLVVFIDDLDRCGAEQALAVLEALKLYLNVDGCVYVIAADRLALERAVEVKYGKSAVGNAKYLDKIVQLPFRLPPIAPSSLDSYVNAQLGDDLQECADLLIAGLGANPRALKRFVNVLALNNELAKSLEVKDFELRWLCIVLLIEYLDAEKYMLICADETALAAMLEKREEEPSPQLRAVLEKIKSPPPVLLPYIHLANVSPADDAEGIRDAEFLRPMQPSAELAVIIGDQPLARTEVTKRVWDYIKRNNLQDAKNKRMINADDALRPIFKGDQRSMFEMTKLISKHLVKI